VPPPLHVPSRLPATLVFLEVGSDIGQASKRADALLREVFADPHALDREMYVTTEHVKAGKFDTIGVPEDVRDAGVRAPRCASARSAYGRGLGEPAEGALSDPYIPLDHRSERQIARMIQRLLKNAMR
jgi:hypothetical protein